MFPIPNGTRPRPCLKIEMAKCELLDSMQAGKLEPEVAFLNASPRETRVSYLLVLGCGCFCGFECTFEAGFAGGSVQEERRLGFMYMLRFGASMAGGNRCDMVVYTYFDDVPRSALSKLSQQPNSLATPIVVAALPDSTPPPPHSPVTPASVVSH
ncbi:hypothetical protein D5086_018357 [Populus alba]|uniref:Uncharacterized protein n=1 Tax=Populus alba TaxID=43335 RepID=A0ACC4BQT9_POPAL